MDYLNIGPGPCDEHVEQVGPNCNYDRMRKECTVFIAQLRRVFGPEPEGARLRTKSEPHEFGNYYEVVCYYSDEIGREYAFKLERETPKKWDKEALACLAG